MKTLQQRFLDKLEATIAEPNGVHLAQKTEWDNIGFIYAYWNEDFKPLVAMRYEFHNGYANFLFPRLGDNEEKRVHVDYENRAVTLETVIEVFQKRLTVAFEEQPACPRS